MTLRWKCCKIEKELSVEHNIVPQICEKREKWVQFTKAPLFVIGKESGICYNKIGLVQLIYYIMILLLLKERET